MKKIKDTTKTATPTAEATVEVTPKPSKPAKKTAPVVEQPASKPAKAAKPAKVAKADADGEVTDRLPGNLDELKETKGGFVAHLYLLGKERDAIAKELAAAFNLADAQAAKIVRRITGRVRLYQRVFDLVQPRKA